MEITSLQNPRVKHIVKLRENRNLRREENSLLVEGYDEIQLALQAGHTPGTVFSAPELVSRQLSVPGAEVVTVNRAVFEKMSYRDNPDGWLAVFPLPKTDIEELRLSAAPLVIVTESVEKPGNLGAILRTAEAAGADALLVCDPRADPWSPNVVRASRGALFGVPLVECESQAALAWLRSRAIRILAATPSANTLYFEADLRQPVAFVVGREDRGLSDFWLSQADMAVRIPMHGRVNSLNVSVSTAILIYEARRQRGPGRHAASA